MIDSHCHLDFADFEAERAAILTRARAAGVTAFVCIGSGEDTASATRPAIAGRRDSWPQGQDEPQPTLMRTPAASLRGAGRLCQGQCPGRSRYSFVPGAVAIHSRRAHLLGEEGPVRFSSRAGRVVGRSPPARGGAAAGVGVTWDGAAAPSPYYLRRPRADLVVSPDPPPRRDPEGRSPRIGIKRARPASHPSVRLPGLRPRAPRRGLAVP